jgi:fatty-acyl-CoA synthase
MGLIDRVASEYAYVTGALRTLGRVTPVAKNKTRTIGDVVEELAGKYGDRDALIGERERLTYRGLDARANQVARWAKAQGVAKGDTVALLMHNRPEYLAIWLGILRMGGVCALLNTALTGPSLAHSIAIVRPRHVIVGEGLHDALQSALPHVEHRPTVWRADEAARGELAFATALDALDSAPIPPSERPALTTDDRALYIYTSGTTGRPKAANINHYRVQAIMNGFSAATNASEKDRMYDCLPLYHTAGGLIGTGTTLLAGGTCIIRERFSARQFWDDIVENDCTMFQYIGELCRYLVNSPPHPKETQHNLRMATGNGLRPDIWTEFQTRFRIPKILEWYAATEGNAVFFNFDGKPGSVGRIPKWAERRFVTEVVAFDVEAEEPVRGNDGFCIKVAPGEVGEVISKILNDPSKPSQRFEGYSDRDSTEKKILRDVFEKGDAWFRTGDLMRKDALGYFYFVDRIGDTFRWKGENVSTSEVGETLTTFPGVREANVYGVHVPGCEGRAGMAALVADEGLDLRGLHAHIARRLPDFARPLFLRFLPEMNITGTFKVKKLDLVREGFDPSIISDDLYFSDPQAQAFVPLDAALYEAIQKGEKRI